MTALIACAARVHGIAVTVKRSPLASTKHRYVSDEKNGYDRTNEGGLDSNVTRGGAFPAGRAFNGTDGQEVVKFSRLREKCTLKHAGIHDPHERWFLGFQGAFLGRKRVGLGVSRQRIVKDLQSCQNNVLRGLSNLRI